MAASINTTVPAIDAGPRAAIGVPPRFTYAVDKRRWKRERREARARLINAAKARRAARASIEGGPR